jgi:hypothetical protein|tara:strand:+ start:345 stop:536 length:192 start_codon:yes stop_codon:yes gene_type:complete
MVQAPTFPEEAYMYLPGSTDTPPPPKPQKRSGYMMKKTALAILVFVFTSTINAYTHAEDLRKV